MNPYRVIFNDDLTTKEQYDFVPDTIYGFTHDEVEPYEANYFIPQAHTEEFEEHLNNSLCVGAWDFIEIE